MFYENVQKIARQKGTTPTGVANAIGLANSAAAKWKRGSVPKADTIQKIADYLDVSIEELLSDNPYRHAAANISNSAIIQGNTGDHVSATVGAVAAKEQPADESELEILRIYRSLNVLEKARFIQMAFEFDGKGK